MIIQENKFAIAERPRVLVSLGTANPCYRKLFEGFLRKARELGPWELVLETGDAGPFDSKTSYTGIVALYQNRKQVEELVSFHGPVLLIHPPQPLPMDFPRRKNLTYVVRDQEKIGRKAVDYFLVHQFRMFAFLGDSPDALWSCAREKGFAGQLARHRLGYEPFHVRGTHERERLRRWLEGLPKPIALFAVCDRLARQALDLCASLSIIVPNEVAILGVDNDEVICETAVPPISSIAMGLENTGGRCAELLAEMMEGSSRECRITALGEPEVINRRSTDYLCVKDPRLACALAFLNANLERTFALADVAAKLNLSSRMLELKAQKELGHSLKTELLEIRLSHACSLLANSSLSVAEIAYRCGFYDASHLGRCFRAKFKISPQRYRC